MSVRLGIVGVGKIAQDQHVPAIAANHAFELLATASPEGRVAGVRCYPTIEELLLAEPGIEALALCQPPQARFAAARAAILAGKHVFLEKPPGVTLAEVELLRQLAHEHHVTLFASWHSREAPGVAAARAWLAPRTLHAVRIVWQEDVRVWHPGQRWIWEPGGLGVFDAGINALSIVSCILPRPMFVENARLSFPANMAAPISAEVTFRDLQGLAIEALFDWRHAGPPVWDISVETDMGTLLLSRGGAELYFAGQRQLTAPEAEYRALYQRFAALIEQRASEVDLTPLRHVADAFLRGTRVSVERFED